MSASTRTGGRGLSLPNIGLSGLARLAGPIFIANLAVMGSVTVDTIMAGRLGVEHLAAVALGGASCATIFIGLMGILQALSPIAGNHFGARNYKRIGFDTVQSGWIAVLLTIIGMTIMLNTWIWTGLGGATGKVKELTEIILVASAFGLPGALASRVFISLNAAVSRPKVTMWVSLASLALKVPRRSSTSPSSCATRTMTRCARSGCSDRTERRSPNICALACRSACRPFSK